MNAKIELLEESLEISKSENSNLLNAIDTLKLKQNETELMFNDFRKQISDLETQLEDMADHVIKSAKKYNALSEELIAEALERDQYVLNIDYKSEFLRAKHKYKFDIEDIVDENGIFSSEFTLKSRRMATSEH